MMARTPDLDVGDKVEFSTTIYINPKKGTEVWLKMGAASTVREGESGGRALGRIQQFIEKKLEKQVDEWYSD